MAKALVMLVRVLGLAAIVLGSLLWFTNHKLYLGVHIVAGLCVVIAVFAMSVMAMTRGAMALGITGILLSLLLPMAGFMQLPLVFHKLGVIQVVHIAIALSTIGLGERLYSAIHRTN